MVTRGSPADATKVTGARRVVGRIGTVVALRFGYEDGVSNAAVRAAEWLGGVGKKICRVGTIFGNFSVAQ